MLYAHVFSRALENAVSSYKEGIGRFLSAEGDRSNRTILRVGRRTRPGVKRLERCYETTKGFTMVGPDGKRQPFVPRVAQDPVIGYFFETNLRNILGPDYLTCSDQVIKDYGYDRYNRCELLVNAERRAGKTIIAQLLAATLFLNVPKSKGIVFSIRLDR